MRLTVALVCALFIAGCIIAGCTPGADHSGSVTPLPTGSASTITVDVSLTEFAPALTPEGLAGGFSSPVLTAPLGSSIRFVNFDSFAHTASSIGTASSFPSGSPFGAGALAQFGSLLSQAWSSGTLQVGGSSQLLVADQRGTYLYGCFFHYGSPMRAVIVVQ